MTSAGLCAFTQSIVFNFEEISTVLPEARQSGDEGDDLLAHRRPRVHETLCQSFASSRSFHKRHRADFTSKTSASAPSATLWRDMEAVMRGIDSNRCRNIPERVELLVCWHNLGGLARHRITIGENPGAEGRQI